MNNQFDYQNTNSAAYNIVPPEDPNKRSKAFSIASMVLGIVAVCSCCCCCGAYVFPALFGVLAVIFAIVARVTSPAKKFTGMAIAGLILGILALVIFILLFAFELFMFTLPEEELENMLKSLMGEEAYQEYLDMIGSMAETDAP
ncbi:MAG: DUF4190 domain-containing protein [Clostridia bacterium]|nr:DUF4190 domain-containing protein [Clostridia bacterium]